MHVYYQVCSTSMWNRRNVLDAGCTLLMIMGFHDIVGVLLGALGGLFGVSALSPRQHTGLLLGTGASIKRGTRLRPTPSLRSSRGRVVWPIGLSWMTTSLSG